MDCARRGDADRRSQRLREPAFQIKPRHLPQFDRRARSDLAARIPLWAFLVCNVAILGVGLGAAMPASSRVSCVPVSAQPQTIIRLQKDVAPMTDVSALGRTNRLHQILSAYSYRDDTTVPPFPDDQPILVFDGKCVLCSATVKFVLAHDRPRRVRFVVAQSPLGGLDDTQRIVNIVFGVQG